eukprot:3268403-Pyramimonas_sp.AAC.1
MSRPWGAERRRHAHDMRSWARLGAHLGPFWNPLGALGAPRGARTGWEGPRGSPRGGQQGPKRAQEDPNSALQGVTFTAREKDTLQGPLKAVLGPYWSRLGALWESSWGLREALGGSLEGLQTAQKGPQEGPTQILWHGVCLGPFWGLLEPFRNLLGTGPRGAPRGSQGPGRAVRERPEGPKTQDEPKVAARRLHEGLKVLTQIQHIGGPLEAHLETLFRPSSSDHGDGGLKTR